jgi:outer membrane protein insertion porin family
VTRTRLSLFVIFLSFFPLGTVAGSRNQTLPNDSVALAIPLGGMPSLHALDALIKKPFSLGTLTYTADTPFEPAEFSYLMEMKPGDLVTAATVKKAIRYLIKKNKFNAIRLKITPAENKPDTKNMHLELESFLMLKRITISGILHGRDTYRYLYDLNPGEAFDEKKHKHSLLMMKEELAHQGYLLATIKDTVTQDHGSKFLTVNLDIQCGPLFRIGSVHVECTSEGEHRVSHGECALLQEKIEKLFAQRLERKMYSSKILDKSGSALKKFLAKKGFLQAAVTLDEYVNREEHKADLVIRVNLQAKKEFVFFGNHFFSDQQLYDMVLSFGQSTLLVPTSLLAQEIENNYHKKGFLKVKVENREEDATCFFVINEGPRAIIEKVEFHGTQQLHTELSRSGFYRRIKKHSFFDEDKIKRVVEALETYYRQAGFSLARASFDTRKIAGMSDRYRIQIHLDAGKRYYLKKITIPSFPELERQGPFLSFSRASDPVPFDSQQLLMQRRWLADYLHQQGYLYFDIKPIVTVKAAHYCFVEVEWSISLQEDKVTFGKTIIVGSSPLPFNRFMRELQYREGETWNKKALESSLFRLRDLSLFSSIHLHPENISAPEAEKIILAKLAEDDPFELRMRAGVLGVSKNLTWREGATYKVGGSLLCKNVFDTGGQLRFDADLTKFERYLSGYYVYPWFFDMPYTTIIKAYSNRYLQPVVQGSKDKLYVAIQQGFVIGLNRKYSHSTTGLNVGFELMETSLKNRAAAEAINFSPALADVKVPYLYLEPTLVVDHLDDKIYPTLGSFTFLSAKGMIPLSKVNDSLIKVLLEQSFFYPVYESLVAGFRCRIGHIFNQCFNQIMPPERFYLGGANSVRGYDPDFAPPLGCFESANKRKKLVPQGGKSMLNVNAELRFPLFKSISGALFQDAGVLIGDDVAAIKEQFVAATGGGIRYNTPVGPLRFDIGFKWKKRFPEDSRMAWFLTLGNAF